MSGKRLTAQKYVVKNLLGRGFNWHRMNMFVMIAKQTRLMLEALMIQTLKLLVILAKKLWLGYTL